ncbi:MAG: DUF3850 domain-containing protein [Desulfobulbus sp.]
MTLHSLKTWPEHFELSRTGKKFFEIRKNDRGFEVGDYLALKEWSPIDRKYSGRVLFYRITCLYKGKQFGIHDEFAILGLSHRVPASRIRHLFGN